jgi:hypothetical protein
MLGSSSSFVKPTPAPCGYLAKPRTTIPVPSRAFSTLASAAGWCQRAAAACGLCVDLWAIRGGLLRYVRTFAPPPPP